MFIYHNPNPKRRSVGDCVIRAISTVTEQNWDDVFWDIVEIAFHEKDMPSSNSIYGKYLNKLGFRRFLISDQCPDCYTVRDFCRDYPFGRYILSLDSHVVAVINGDYYDTWDSGSEVPLFYWKEMRL